MRPFKKKLLLTTIAITLFNATYPVIASAEEMIQPEAKVTDTATLGSNQFIGEDGNVYTEKDLVDALSNGEAVVSKLGEEQSTSTGDSFQIASAAAGSLGWFLGSSLAIPGIGQVVITVGGLAIGGIVVFKAGSWAWNKAKAYMADETNWTADQIISKKRKGSIRREFPSEYLKKTLKQINAEAKKGNARARKAKKLLQDGRFKK